MRIARYLKQERRDFKMRTSLALSVLVVTWTVVAARAGPTGTGETGETLPCTCVPICTVYMYVLLCLVVCLILHASFFLPSLISH